MAATVADAAVSDGLAWPMGHEPCTRKGEGRVVVNFMYMDLKKSDNKQKVRVWLFKLTQVS